jgi:5-methyltetrahydrofolate--homocysteine methyltransferase
MIVIGELINASRKAIGAAIEAQDTAAIHKVAQDQDTAGADFIDVNAGIFVGKEPEYLKWLVETVQAASDKPCAIDSPDPKAIEAAMAVHKGTPMINSISLEKHRYDNLMPIVAGTDLKVIALCMSNEGMPETVDDRMKIADKLVNGLLQNNVKMENIYVDPLVQPMSVNNSFGVEFVGTIEKIVLAFADDIAEGAAALHDGLEAKVSSLEVLLDLFVGRDIRGEAFDGDKAPVLGIDTGALLPGPAIQATEGLDAVKELIAPFFENGVFHLLPYFFLGDVDVRAAVSRLSISERFSFYPDS